ncbi:MAG: radical SAM protein, partial [Gracilibacteraceae bacterium]|nr:radical SAM protein [Gracilibacteraceae bacterium]
MKTETPVSLKALGEKALREEKLFRAEALAVLNLPEETMPELLALTLAVRQKHKGMKVGVQWLTNAKSGNCTQNCAYCAQSLSAQTDIPKYGLTPYAKLAADGAVVAEKGLARHCIGLSGIRFDDAEIEDLADQVRRLKGMNGTPICCSIGFLTPEQAMMLKKAGVDRINHNLNTSRRHYANI